MARSLLRAAQLRDEDVMEEAEHDAWVHVNLVTSGTLNFQDGTISGTGDVYATTFYGDGSNLTGLSSSPESLYYNGTDVRATATNTGLQITDNTNIGNLGYHGAAGALVLTNTNHGAGIWMYGEDNAGANKALLFADPDGALRLYHAGDQTLFTKAGGFYIQNGGDQAYMSLSTDIYYHNHVHGGRHFFRAEQTDGTQVTTALLDPDGASELYYSGVKAAETHSQGIIIHRDDASATLSMKFDASGNMIIDNDTGNNITLQANGKNLFGAWGNGVASVYYGGELRLATYSQGIILHRDDVHTRLVHSVGGDFIIQPDEPGGTIQLRGITTASGNDGKTLAIFDPDGAAELYHSGDKVFETTATSGINVVNEVTAVTYYGDGSNLTGITVSGTNPESLYYNGTDVKATAVADGIEITNGTDTASILYGGEELQIYNTRNSGTIELRAKNSAGALTPLANFDPDGSTILRSEGNDILSVSSNSINIKNAANDSVDISPGAAASIASRYDGGTIQIEGDHVSDGSQAMMFLADPDGAAELYYAGNKIVETNQSGVRSGLIFHNIDESESAWMEFGGAGNFYIKNNAHGGGVFLQGENSTGTIKSLATFSPNQGASGGCTLYYDGAISMSTRINGIDVVNNTTAATATLTHEDTVLRLWNYTDGSEINLSAYNSSHVMKSLINLDPDGAAELYHAGIKTVETYQDTDLNRGGLWFHDDVGGGLFEISVAQNETTYLANKNTSGIIIVGGMDSTDAWKQFIVADPDGSTALYHAGVKQLETTVSGISVPNGQIKFPATQNPSSDVNTLDDYEEGTWTPTVYDATTGGNQGTPSAASGVYTKIGRTVHLTGNLTDINTAGMTAGNPVVIRDLPFTNGSNGNHVGSVNLGFITFSGFSVVQLGANSTWAVIRNNISGAAYANILVSALTSGSADIEFSITYNV